MHLVSILVNSSDINIKRSGVILQTADDMLKHVINHIPSRIDLFLNKIREESLEGSFAFATFGTRNSNWVSFTFLL